MLTGKKYLYNSIIYTRFKKHYCPICKTKLKVIKKSEIVNSKSPEAKRLDFQIGDTWVSGDVKFIWEEFYCPVCKKQITIDELKKAEKCI